MHETISVLSSKADDAMGNCFRKFGIMPWVKLVLIGKAGKVDAELQALKGAWTSKAALTSREYDVVRHMCQVGESQSCRVGPIVPSPQATGHKL